MLLGFFMVHLIGGSSLMGIEGFTGELFELGGGVYLWLLGQQLGDMPVAQFAGCLPRCSDASF